MASASHPFNADLTSESNESSAGSSKSAVSASAIIEDLSSSNEPVASSAETNAPEADDLEADDLEANNLEAGPPAESGVAHFLRQLSDRTAAESVSYEQPPELAETPPQGFTGFAGLDIQQLAAEGYFQAIAYWLNEPLIPQNVYAQVLADEVPGRLKILVEFEHAPQPQRLIRFVCDRLYKLNSNVIEGVHLIARALGAAQTDWEQSIRIPTALQRVEKQRRVQQPPSATSQLAYESSRTQVARQVMRSQFKFFRAALVSGAAAAAFLFGGFTELVLSNRLPATGQNPAPQKAIPWYGDTADADFAPVTTAQTATPVSFRPASRFKSRTVEAALETVAVSPHDAVQNPSDPTITLLFGGELSLKNFKFDAADDLDHLFSDIEIYEQADVAMVGLAEPLANASTSLQEDFYHRTRPQAVQALKTGGIDIVGLAGEGSLTYGSHGLNETLTNLDRQGIYRVGAGRNQQEAHRPEILEVKGQRIAYLGYNPDALKGAKAEKAGVALTTSKDRQHIIEDIKAIRSQVDWIVVNYRWADALETLEDTLEEKIKDVPALPSLPEDWQKSLAREAVDAGADLVVGYHPNKIQGAEIYHDRAIAYSLGDFVFQEEPLKDHDTAALRVSLRNQQMKVEFLPITIQESKLQMATGEKGAAILKTIRQASKTFEKPMRFPTVLNAKPNRFLPASQHKTSAGEFSELTPEVLPSETSDEIFSTPNPAMPESEALFMPAEDLPLEYNSPEESTFKQNTLKERAAEEKETPDPDNPESNLNSNQEADPIPWQDPWNDDSFLEDWGEKKTSPQQEFEPIPAERIQREKRGDSPEIEGAETWEQETPHDDAEIEWRIDSDLDSDFNPEVGPEVGPEIGRETVPDSHSEFESAPIPTDDYSQLPADSAETAYSNDYTEEYTEHHDSPLIPEHLTTTEDNRVEELSYEETGLQETGLQETGLQETGLQETGLQETEPGVIPPYEEPLVGPLSTLPASVSSAATPSIPPPSTPTISIADLRSDPLPLEAPVETPVLSQTASEQAASE